MNNSNNKGRKRKSTHPPDESRSLLDARSVSTEETGANGAQEQREVLLNCPDCGNEVPEANLALHQVRCLRAASRTAANRASEADSAAPDPSASESVASALQSASAPESSASQEPALSTPPSVTPQQVQSQWACPRCTLLNPSAVPYCDACLLPRPISPNNDTQTTTVRPPDPTQTQTLVPPFPAAWLAPPEGTRIVSTRDIQINSPAPTPLRVLNGALNGAFLGGLFGGILGLGVGAIAGATGGALANRMLSQQEEAQLQGPGRTNHSNGVAISRARITVVSAGPHGVRRVTYQGVPTSTNTTTTPGAPESPVDRLILQMLLRHAMAQGLNMPNGEPYTYEELLHQFGVGNEHRGATQQVIDSLPCTTVDTDAKDLDEETCGICLEKYAPGNVVRKLYCSHCFHQECIDRWLHQVASCPICKHEVRDEREEGQPTGVTPGEPNAADRVNQHEHILPNGEDSRG